MLGRRITTSGGPNVNPQYEYVDINGDYNLNTEQVDNNTLVTVSNTLGSPHVITYGTNLTPLTITLQDGETQTFVFSAVSGWQLSSNYGKVVIATSSFTSTNDVEIEIGDIFIQFTNGETFANKKLDFCGVNEFLHNIGEFHALISHEGGPGNSKTVRVNGVGATFQNLENATDNGNGVIQFSGGTNQVFNRNGSTVETVRDVGEYFEIVAGGTGQFDTQFFSLNTNPTVRGFINSLTTEEIQLRFGPNGYTLFDPTGANVSSGPTENGTYRFTRTLYGWEVTRNGAVIYESPEVCNKYGEIKISQDDNNVLEERNDGLFVNVSQISANTGLYRLSEHKPATPINTSTNAVGTNIITGHDLTQSTGMELKFVFVDQANSQVNPWQTLEVDVDQVIAAFNNGSAVDGYLLIFDNDWVRLNIVDLATGEINIVDQGRDMAYVKSELWIAAPEQDGFFEVANVGTITTTGTFQNLGDSNSLFTDEDGSTVFIEYGDGNRDRFTFLDGIAKGERKGFETNDIEIQVVSGGQLQIRDLNAQSGVLRAWYQLPIKAVGFSQQPHVADSQTLSGIVDADLLLSNTENGQAFHFQAIFGDLTLTSASEIATAINGDLIIQGSVSPLIIPFGTQGYITKNNGTITVHYNTEIVEILDVISDFSGTAIKSSFENLLERPYTVLEDAATTVSNVSKTFDSLITPFVELEVIREIGAAHGVMLRANSTGGRQSQLRFNISDGSFSVANSGANTELPTVYPPTITEETIKYFIRWNDPVAHTDLEISPAAHDASLTPNPSLQESTGIIKVKLYEDSPLNTVLTSPNGNNWLISVDNSGGLITTQI